MLVHVQHIDRAPQGAVVHYLERKYGFRESFSHAGFCGTFSYNTMHTDNPDRVTCRRCLAKLKNKIEN